MTSYKETRQFLRNQVSNFLYGTTTDKYGDRVYTMQYTHGLFFFVIVLVFSVLMYPYGTFTDILKVCLSGSGTTALLFQF